MEGRDLEVVSVAAVVEGIRGETVLEEDSGLASDMEARVAPVGNIVRVSMWEDDVP